MIAGHTKTRWDKKSNGTKKRDGTKKNATGQTGQKKGTKYKRDKKKQTGQKKRVRFSQEVAQDKSPCEVDINEGLVDGSRRSDWSACGK